MAYLTVQSKTVTIPEFNDEFKYDDIVTKEYEVIDFYDYHEANIKQPIQIYDDTTGKTFGVKEPRRFRQLLDNQPKFLGSHFKGEITLKDSLDIAMIRVTSEQYRPIVVGKIIDVVKNDVEEIIVNDITDFKFKAPNHRVIMRVGDYDASGQAYSIGFANWNTGGHRMIIASGISVQVCSNGLVSYKGEGAENRVWHSQSALNRIYEMMDKAIQVSNRMQLKIDKIKAQEMILTLPKKWQNRLEERRIEYTTLENDAFDSYIQPITHLLTHEELPFNVSNQLQKIVNETVEMPLITA